MQPQDPVQANKVAAAAAMSPLPDSDDDDEPTDVPVHAPANGFAASSFGAAPLSGMAPPSTTDISFLSRPVEISKPATFNFGARSDFSAPLEPGVP